MAMKKNNPGCGCCGCACDVLGVALDGPTYSGNCCDAADGTFLMTPASQPGLDYCVDTASVPKNGSPVASDLPPTTGPDCSNECDLTFSTTNPNNITVCAEEVENLVYGFGSTPYCAVSWLMLYAVDIELRVARVSGVSRITVIVTWEYTEAWTRIDFDVPDNRYECIRYGWQATPLRLWRVTDTYQLDNDCTDGVEVPYLSRTMEVFGTGSTGSDETQIIWGETDSFTYTLCDPVTVTLVA